MEQVCANPSQPMFNHYLFETLAALLRTVCSSNPAPEVDAKFEELLMPPFNVRG